MPGDLFSFSVCREDAVDIVIMIDGSSSINFWGENNFALIVNATGEVMNKFTSPRSRIGLVLFTSEAELKINLNSTHVQRYEAINRLSPLPGARMMGKALNFTRELLFEDSRINALRVLVVLAHGTSNDDVLVPAKLLHGMNVTVLVVALGDWFDIKQVEEIASDPESKFLLKAKVSELESFIWRVEEMICEGMYCITII